MTHLRYLLISYLSCVSCTPTTLTWKSIQTKAWLNKVKKNLKRTHSSLVSIFSKTSGFVHTWSVSGLAPQSGILFRTKALVVKIGHKVYRIYARTQIKRIFSRTSTIWVECSLLSILLSCSTELRYWLSIKQFTQIKPK